MIAQQAPALAGVKEIVYFGLQPNIRKQVWDLDWAEARDDNRVKYGIIIKELGGSSFRWNDKSGGMDREIPAFAGIG